MKLNAMLKYALLLLAVSFTLPCDGQPRRSRSASPDIVERLWVGSNLNNLRFGSNFFSFGLSPTVGIEVIDNVSLGAMIKIDYFTQRDPFPPRLRFTSVDLGPTGFARFVVAQQFFGQVEYERAFLPRPVDIVNNEYVKETIQQNYLYVGAGMIQGAGPWFTTISLHYNVLDDIDSERFPWDYRFGLVYEFGDGADTSEDRNPRKRKRRRRR